MAYSISNLPTYPQNGEHQRITIHGMLPFPLKITRGEDTWYFYNAKGIQEAIKPKLWYVYISDNFLAHQGMQIKGFRKPDAAVRYAMRTYGRWLRAQSRKVKEFKIEEC